MIAWFVLAVSVGAVVAMCDIWRSLALDTRKHLCVQLDEAEAYAIETTLGLTLEDDPACSIPCTARHCAQHAAVHGTSAQRRPSRAAEQRWNASTQPLDVSELRELAILAELVPDVAELLASPRERFASANPYAVHRHMAGAAAQRGRALGHVERGRAGSRAGACRPDES